MGIARPLESGAPLFLLGVLLVSFPTAAFQSSDAGLEGTWALVANNYKGRLEITRSGSGYTGRVAFSGSSWEPINRISYNARSGEVVFVRAIPNQVHRGALSGNRMSGRFDNAYDWSATREGAAAPSPPTSGKVSTPPPTPAPSAAGLEGTWALVANNHKGRLEITRSGSGYTGRVAFSGSSWEPINRISYNSRSGEVVFVRVVPNQVHRGTLSGNRMSGRFDNAYDWSATREGAAAPSSPPPPQSASGVHYRVENFVYNAPDAYQNPRNYHSFMVDFAKCTVRELNQESNQGLEQIRISVCRPKARLTFTTVSPKSTLVEYDWVFLDGGRTISGAYRQGKAFGPSVGGIYNP